MPASTRTGLARSSEWDDDEGKAVRLTYEQAKRERSAERMAFDAGFYGFLGALVAAMCLAMIGGAAFLMLALLLN